MITTTGDVARGAEAIVGVAFAGIIAVSFVLRAVRRVFGMAEGRG